MSLRHFLAERPLSVVAVAALRAGSPWGAPDPCCFPEPSGGKEASAQGGAIPRRTRGRRTAFAAASGPEQSDVGKPAVSHPALVRPSRGTDSIGAWLCFKDPADAAVEVWRVQDLRRRLADRGPWAELRFKSKGRLFPADCPLAQTKVSPPFYEGHWPKRRGPLHCGGESALPQIHQFKCSAHPEHTCTETSRIMFNKMSGHPGPATLTHKINRHGAHP